MFNKVRYANFDILGSCTDFLGISISKDISTVVLFASGYVASICSTTSYSEELSAV